ncbi:MAG: hypothetical protein RIT28_3662 [Pseudomonadota bacterium]
MRLSGVLLGLLGLPGLAWAEPSGRVLGWAFEEGGAPAIGLGLTLCGQSVQTDARGAFAVDCSPGEVTLVGPGWSTVTVVAPGAETEALLTVVGGLITAASVEAQPLAQRVAADAVLVTLTGVILDTETGEPVAEARVYARGQDAEGVSDAQGRFTLTLPAGEHQLSVVHARYSAATLSALATPNTDSAPLSVSLRPAGLSLADWVVSAPRVEGGTAALLDERREATTVNDVLGAEEMARSGASDAASALQRVTGLTLVGGRYIYVRGLGERYSSTLLNGSSLPSPEPERRVVPLDLFPASMLEAVIVQKSYSPDMPGEFGGGVLSLRTRKAPAEPTLKIGLSGGFTQGVTGQTGFMAPGGAKDWTGRDDGSRALPVGIATADKALTTGNMFVEGYSEEELEAFGESLPNRFVMNPRTLPPDAGLSVSGGDSVTLGGLTLGGLAAITYGQSWDLNRYERTWYALGSDGLQVYERYDFEEVERNVRLGGVVTTSALWGDDQEIVLTSALNRNTDQSERLQEGFDAEEGALARTYRSRWIERQLLYEQVTGHHPIGEGLIVDWRYGYAKATRAEPDRLEWSTLQETDGDWVMHPKQGRFLRYYGGMVDQSHDGAFDLTAPVQIGETELTLKGGLWMTKKSRASELRRLGYKIDNAQDLVGLASDQWFTKEHINADQIRLEESSAESDDYTAQQRQEAVYLMATVPVGERLSVVGGARLERSTQEVQSYKLFSVDPTDASSTTTLRTTDLLPAVNTAYDLGESQKVRVSYAKTVSRPDLRELSEVRYYEVVANRAIQGNPELQRGLIHHVDARLERYPAPGESVSLALFYKRFVDPIESVVIPGSDQTRSFANAPSATNLGVEVEARRAIPWVPNLYAAGNVSLIRSRVDLTGLDGTQTSSERPLQGQSPYVVNAQLSYEDAERGLNAALLYNVSGPRIDQVGVAGLPDAYELPVHRLDLVASAGLPRGFTAQVKLQNLLTPALRSRMGTEYTYLQPADQWSASLGLSWGL